MGEGANARLPPNQTFSSLQILCWPTNVDHEAVSTSGPSDWIKDVSKPCLGAEGSEADVQAGCLTELGFLSFDDSQGGTEEDVRLLLAWATPGQIHRGRSQPQGCSGWARFRQSGWCGTMPWRG